MLLVVLTSRSLDKETTAPVCPGLSPRSLLFQGKWLRDMAILVLGKLSNSHFNKVIRTEVKLEWVKECIGGKEMETVRVGNFLKCDYERNG